MVSTSKLQTRTLSLFMVGGLLATAACSHQQKAETLPPPPPEAVTAADIEPATPVTVDPRNVPGTHENFVSVTGSDRVFFAFDKSDLDSQSRATLDAQAAWLTQNGGIKVRIEGHTDARGTREYNLALGQRRADAAKDYLISKGVNSKRITTISYGKERPAVEGTTDYAYAKNRRSVTVLVNPRR